MRRYNYNETVGESRVSQGIFSAFHNFFLRHVLTAAHCIVGRDISEFVEVAKVRVGSIYYQQVVQEIGITDKSDYHNRYQNTGGGYDIAVLHLAEDIAITKDAFPACLYHGDRPLVYESRATVIGFGKTHSW